MKVRFRYLAFGLLIVCLLLLNMQGTSEASPRGRRVLVEATAYSPQDPGLSNVTATGAKLGKGIIAVDPDFIPLGTWVYIPDYGEAVAADTGGAISGNVIDVAFDTHAEALAFGYQEMYIVIMDESDDDEDEMNEIYQRAEQEDDDDEEDEEDDEDDNDRNEKYQRVEQDDKDDDDDESEDE